MYFLGQKQASVEYFPSIDDHKLQSFAISDYFGTCTCVKDLITVLMCNADVSLFSCSDLALRNCYLTADLTVKVGDYGIGPYRYKVSLNLNFRSILQRDYLSIIITVCFKLGLRRDILNVMLFEIAGLVYQW